MTPDDAVSLIVGPAGALIVLAAVLLSMTRYRFLVPYFIYETEKKAREKLDQENERLNDTVIKLTNEIAEYRVKIAAQTTRIQHLEDRVNALQEELMWMHKQNKK